jgi:hypothetical protein
MKRLPGIVIAGLASIAAGAIHGGAIGLHAEHPQLARIFIVVTLAQLAWGLSALLRPQQWLLPVGVLINGAAVGGWITTRIAGISWIDGLEVRESVQLADSLCAGLGIVAATVALSALLVGERELPQARLALPSFAILLLVLPAMWNGASHLHSEGGMAHADGHGAEEAGHHDPATTPIEQIVSETPTTGKPTFAAWPRPYDPALPLDISNVANVSAEQESRAKALIELTQRELPTWADYQTALDGGWQSIGDGSTGFEHFIKRELIQDDNFLDPTAPEALVYKVEGTKRTLVSVMFIAKVGVTVDDPSLTDFAGGLIQWHSHDNLCWRNNAQGVPVIAGLTDGAGNCPPGSVRAGGNNAMVHVWITPHLCGPFAALEGAGAGRSNVSDSERVDLCNAAHEDSPTTPTPVVTTDPTITTFAPAPTTTAAPSFNDTGASRISLGGFPGVTADQQARAEDLLYRTREILPKFASTQTALDNGFTSIQDAGTGVEHYINWSYINDEHELDPNYPESLVYQVGAGGKRTLVSAMYMVGDEYELATVPAVGGALTQWHIHNNLCFDQDPSVTGVTRVVGVTSENGPCSFGIKLNPNPMLHVWLVPQKCGPFAALEGVGAGQVIAGESRLCDEAHGHG